MGATDAANDLLVGPEWIAEHVDDPDLRMVELDVSRSAYDAGHIPGAVLWTAYGDLRGPDYVPIGRDEFAGLLSRSGIAPRTTVVLYGYAAYLGVWLMRRHGHEEVRVMDGARERWELAGQPWTSEVPAITETPAYPPARSAPEVDCQVEALLTTVDQPGDVALLDVRSQLEFDGERFWPSGATEGAGRAGHLPGAVHVPFELLRDEDGEFKSAARLRALYAEHGITPDRPVVTYCTIGNRAAQAWFVLTYVLGYPDARVYFGSWAEWGTRADTPVA